MTKKQKGKLRRLFLKGKPQGKVLTRAELRELSKKSQPVGFDSILEEMEWDEFQEEMEEK